MEVRWLVDYEVPTCMFVGVAATFQVIFDRAACAVWSALPNVAARQRRAFGCNW
jgi:hypothetical protein